jgi:phosphatidyl-myo-inositol dimannoside synthase
LNSQSETCSGVVAIGHLNLLLAWLLARLRGARLALIIHGIEAWKRRSWLYGLMLKSVDSFIAVSRYSAGRFTAWSNVSKKQFFILPNCVDLDLFVPGAREVKLVERYGVRDNKLILTVGQIASHVRYKGFDEVIEAMPELLRRFPSLKYMIVGDGDDRGRLEEKVTSLGLSELFLPAKFHMREYLTTVSRTHTSCRVTTRGVWCRISRSSCMRCSGDR